MIADNISQQVIRLRLRKLRKLRTLKGGLLAALVHYLTELNSAHHLISSNEIKLRHQGSCGVGGR